MQNYCIPDKKGVGWLDAKQDIVPRISERLQHLIEEVHVEELLVEVHLHEVGVGLARAELHNLRQVVGGASTSIIFLLAFGFLIISPLFRLFWTAPFWS